MSRRGDRVTIALLALALATALANTARAQGPPASSGPGEASAPETGAAPGAPTGTARRRDPPELLRLGGSYTAPASLQDGGRVSISRASLSTGYAGRFESGLFLLGTLALERSWYRFESAAGLSPEGTTAVRATSQVDLFCLASIPLSETLTLGVGPLASFSAEEGARLGPAINLGGTVSLGWQVLPDLSLSVGAVGITRFEASPLVIPTLGFDWRPTDHLRLRTRGTTLEAAWEVEGWRLAAFGTWKLRQYRLDDVGQAPGGVLEDQRIVVGLDGEWRPRPWLAIGARTGLVAWQRFVVRDDRGHFLGGDRTDPTLELGVALVVRLVF